MARNTLTEEQWEIRFTPVHPEASLTLPDPLEIRKTWTVIEVDGVYYIIPGIHTVNRVGFIITKEEWTDADLLDEWYW